MCRVTSFFLLFFDSAKTAAAAIAIAIAIVDAVASLQPNNICITFVYYVYYAVRCLMLGCLS